ncbi:MAG: NADPH-dependent F420 reductase [Anaerolineae bacterium]
MNIGIVGVGRMGTALARRWHEKGHAVFLGSRDSQKAADVADRIGADVRWGSYQDAATWAKVVVLAVPWGAVRETIAQLGDLDGKVLLDVTYPFLPDGTRGVPADSSAGEEVARLARGARVVKALNHMGYQNFANPAFGDQQATGFLCGDDQAARYIVSGLLRDIGLDVIDIGPLANARLLEALATLWVELAFRQGLGPTIAFRVLRR